MAVTGGIVPKYQPGQKVSLKASAAVTQGSFVEVSGSGTVAMAAAGSTKIVGVALQTAGAANDIIAVQLCGYVFAMKAKGAVTFGDPVGAASDGTAAVSTITVSLFSDVRKVFGIALASISDGAVGLIYVNS